MIIKNFLSSDCVAGLLESAANKQLTDWDTSGYTIPFRMGVNINDYPVLKEEALPKLGNDFYYTDKVFFNKYVSIDSPELSQIPNRSVDQVSGTQKVKNFSSGPVHQDPCNYTVVVLLQEPKMGGRFYLRSSDFIPLSPGDAVVFKGNTNHRITEVIMGTRISLTFWLNSIPDALIS